MKRYQRGPHSMGLAFGELADELAPETLLAEVQRVWPRTVGDAIAAEARPTAERGGMLTVSCSASVWAQELDLMAPQIVSRLNDGLARGTVQRLRCVAVGYAR